MNKIAILITCHNRRNKTINCLNSIRDTKNGDVNLEVFLTDDGSTDGTSEAIINQDYDFPITIIRGDGNLYWNGGMIKSWEKALSLQKYDGYLWLNDDVVLLPNVWSDLLNTDEYCKKKYGKSGIYVGSTKDRITGKLTYGGFNFEGKWRLIDKFVEPNGSTAQACQCAHGNVTLVSHEVVEHLGIFTPKYFHGGSDHDYTYRAYRANFPVLVMPHYAAVCENDHRRSSRDVLLSTNLKGRMDYLKSPFGLNLHNTLLFQRRCFPHRYILVCIVSYLKAIFPRLYFKFFLS